jgi:hypothetical protein
MPTRGPNSPREIHDGEVCPREMKPEIASKSKVRQTMCLGILSIVSGDSWIVNRGMPRLESRITNHESRLFRYDSG